MSREIEFRILPNGKIEMEMIGFEGEGCSEEAMKQIEQLGKDLKMDRKPEYYYGSCDNKQSDQNKNRGY